MTPTHLLVETARMLTPGRALDLACGSGRNAIWLAEHGWQVTAVDSRGRVLARSPALPDLARVRVLDPGRAENLKRELGAAAGSRLAAAGLYLREGMLDDAEREAASLQTENAGSPPAARLIGAVRALRPNAAIVSKRKTVWPVTTRTALIGATPCPVFS